MIDNKRSRFESSFWFSYLRCLLGLLVGLEERGEGKGVFILLCSVIFFFFTHVLYIILCNPISLYKHPLKRNWVVYKRSFIGITRLRVGIKAMFALIKFQDVQQFC